MARQGGSAAGSNGPRQAKVPGATRSDRSRAAVRSNGVTSTGPPKSSTTAFTGASFAGVLEEDLAPGRAGGAGGTVTRTSPSTTRTG